MRVKGFAALYASATIFAFVSLCVKFASRSFAGYFVSGMRFAMGMALCFGVLFWRYRGIKVVKPLWVLLRGLAGAISMVASYVAISLTGPGRATLLSNTYPLFVALFGALLFGERLKPRTFFSIVVCTLGAGLVMKDGSGASLAGDLLALASAIFAGFAVNFVRKASSAGDNPFVLYLSPCVFGLPVLAFAPAPAGPPGALAIGFLVFVGVGSFAAQALMSVGYRSVPANRGSVVFYWETALTVLLGFAFAGEKPNLRFLLGVVIILAGLWLNGERAMPRRKGEGGGEGNDTVTGGRPS